MSTSHDPVDEAGLACVGRMTILSKLGEGGMGVVYAAYDPELDRKVAVKILRIERGESDRSRARLLREAQALAGVSHPHIVAVHDVGVEGDRLWLAMEFVRGQTLSEWCAKQPRRWRDVVTVFIQAARGIAAVHKAGFLHCDVKPANIMIGDDGRVRVTDFGLVRKTHHPDEPTVAATGLTFRELGPASSRHGTPAYMAPEQFIGFELDGRADQYSLCVALWEALHGVRPYPDRSVAALAGDILSGQRPSLPRRPRSPGWLRRVLMRGLSARRELRYPDMDALATALAADPLRRRVALAVVLLAGIITASVVAALRIHEHEAVAACEAAGAAIDGSWNDTTRHELRYAFERSRVPFASTSSGRAIRRLDEYSRQWRQTRVAVCRAQLVERTWQPTLAEQARACLEERREQFDSLVSSLTRVGDADDALGVVEGAVVAVAKLPTLAACQDERRIRARPRPPDGAEARSLVAQLRGRLARAAALERIGRHEQGVALVQDVRRAAETLEWRPLIASARLAHGNLLRDLSNYELAAKTLDSAYLTAGSSNDDEVAFEAAFSLALVTGYDREQYEDGIHWAETALMVLDRAGAAEDDLRRAAVQFTMAVIYRAAGETERAADLAARAQIVHEQALGADHPSVAKILGERGHIYNQLGDEARTLEFYERALERTREIFGDDHPKAAVVAMDLGMFYLERADHPRAMPLLERAHSISQAAFGANHLQVAASFTNLGSAYEAQGDFGRALEYHNRALAIYERTHGPEFRAVGNVLNNLASVYNELGMYERSVETLGRALAISSAWYGAESEAVARLLGNLAIVHEALEHHDVAIVHLKRSLAILEKVVPPTHMLMAQTHAGLGVSYQSNNEQARALAAYERSLSIILSHDPNHPRAADPLAAIGAIHLDRGDYAKAREALERAFALHEQFGGIWRDTARVQFALARALWPSRDQRPRAIDLGRRARDGYLLAGSRGAADRAQVEAWLKARSWAGRDP